MQTQHDSRGNRFGLVLLLAILLFCVAGFAYYSWNPDDTGSCETTVTKGDRKVGSSKKDVPGSGALLEIAPKELTMDQGGLVQNATVTYEGEDVTQEAHWLSYDEKIALVTNAEPVKGQISGTGVGETEIRVTFKEMEGLVRVKVLKPELRVECFPNMQTVGVGEEVIFHADYKGLGLPYYSYEWSGDDGLTGKDADVGMKYGTPGVKKVHFKTVDRNGEIAEDDCEVIVNK